MNDTSEVKFCLRKLAMLELEAIQAIWETRQKLIATEPVQAPVR
jgi:hypothetical protein